MAVLIIADVNGQTREGYDGMIAALGEALKQAPGLMLHTSHPIDGGWRVIEVWQSRAEATAWFAACIVPHLPPGIRPRRTFYEVHHVVRAEAAPVARGADGGDGQG